jgi:hypothetical protein
LDQFGIDVEDCLSELKNNLDCVWKQGPENNMVHEVAGGYTKLRDGEFHNLHYSATVLKSIN